MYVICQAENKRLVDFPIILNRPLCFPIILTRPIIRDQPCFSFKILYPLFGERFFPIVVSFPIFLDTEHLKVYIYRLPT